MLAQELHASRPSSALRCNPRCLIPAIAKKNICILFLFGIEMHIELLNFAIHYIALMFLESRSEQPQFFPEFPAMGTKLAGAWHRLARAACHADQLSRL
jgi:hypothetical protein